MHVERRCVSVSHYCPAPSSTAGAHHKCEIQEWPFPGVSFASALGGDLGSVSYLCRMQTCIQKPRVLAILSVRTRQRKPLRGACCCAGPAGQKKCKKNVIIRKIELWVAFSGFCDWQLRFKAYVLYKMRGNFVCSPGHGEKLGAKM